MDPQHRFLNQSTINPSFLLILSYGRINKRVWLLFEGLIYKKTNKTLIRITKRNNSLNLGLKSCLFEKIYYYWGWYR